MVNVEDSNAEEIQFLKDQELGFSDTQAPSPPGLDFTNLNMAPQAVTANPANQFSGVQPPTATPQFSGVQAPTVPMPAPGIQAPAAPGLDQTSFAPQVQGAMGSMQDIAGQQAGVYNELVQPGSPLLQGRTEEAIRRDKFFTGEDILDEYGVQKLGPDGKIQRTPGFDDLQKSLETKREALKEQKVDPNKWYNDQGTAGMIGIALMAGLTEYGNRLSGRSGNAVLSMMDKAVQRDISAQKFSIQQAKQDYDLTRGDMSDKLLMEKVKRADAAQLEARIYSDADMRLKGLAAQSKVPELQMKAAQISQSFVEKKNNALINQWKMTNDIYKTKASLKQSENREATRQKEYQEGRTDRKSAAALVQKGAMNRATVAAKLAADKEEKALLKESKELAIPGWELGNEVTPGKDETKKLRLAKSNIDSLRLQIRDYKKKMKVYGPQASYIANPKAAKSMAAAHKGIMMKVKELDELGALTGPDMDLIKAQMPPDPDSMTGITFFENYETGAAQLNELDTRLNQAFESRMEVSGYKSLTGSTEDKKKKRLDFINKYKIKK
tara:strand:+ start:2181 stop:3839 length:1659 start_codon:yes stop_codon:yes gene_type:complete